MKTLLTLFVLFFSSSVFANEDLSGKSIVCGTTLEYLCNVFGNKGDCPDSPNREVIMAVEFTNKDQALYYDYKGTFFNSKKNIIEYPFFYKTNLESIMLYHDITDQDAKYFLKINRTTLDSKFAEEDGYDLPIGKSCLVYKNYEDINDNILKMRDKIIAEITKDNKL